MISRQDKMVDGFHLVEGDILLDDEQGMERNAVPYDYQLWPGGVVVYYIEPDVEPHRRKIEQVMRYFEDRTCIIFRERTNEETYVHIYESPGRCYSRVGNGRGPLPMSLGSVCKDTGTIIHELGHAIGFWHEHSRSDRDKYLNIFRENIMEGQAINFVKLTDEYSRILGPFDYESIMLYGEYAFSKDPKRLKTMSPKVRGVTMKSIGEKGLLSLGDIEKINKLYECP